MILRKVNTALDDALVVHLDQIALTDFLIMGDKSFAVCAGDFEDMTASDFLAVWVFAYIHGITLSVSNFSKAASNLTLSSFVLFAGPLVRPPPRLILLPTKRSISSRSILSLV